MNVDRTGTFRAEVVENGVGETRKAGYPQFLVNAKLLELWDEETETWVPWAEYEQDVDCRLCLFGMVGKKKEFGTTLTYDQVCKVFNWDGADLVELANDRTGTKFQVRIEDNDPEYAEKTPFQVNWVDEYDAVPGRKIKKLDATELKAMNAKYAMILKNKAKPAAPAKAPAKASAKAPVAPKTAGIVTKKGKKQTQAAKAKAPVTPPKAPPKAPVSPGVPEGKCTKTEAWGTVVGLKNDDCSDEQLNAAWLAAIAATAPDVADKDITPEQWFTIKDAVLDDVGKF